METARIADLRQEVGHGVDQIIGGDAGGEEFAE